MSTTYLEDCRQQRETTYIYRTLIRCMKIQQYGVPLPPIQVARNKGITYSYTICDSVSLNTGFPFTAVNNCEWSCHLMHARLSHNTKMINNVATAILTGSTKTWNPESGNGNGIRNRISMIEN